LQKSLNKRQKAYIIETFKYHFQLSSITFQVGIDNETKEINYMKKELNWCGPY
jgi:hypothetical protein